MSALKYYDRFDEKILVLASLLVATLILFVLTFFLGCGRDGTHPGTLGNITYTDVTDNMPGNIHEYTKVFIDDTTGTKVEIGWRTRCDSAGCINVSADVILIENHKNCLVRALLPNNPTQSAFVKNNVGMTDVILTFEMSSMLDKNIHVRHYHLFADGGSELL